MKRITVKKAMSDADAERLKAVLLTDNDYDQVISDTCAVYKENGEPLLIYIKGAISDKACMDAYLNLRDAAAKTSNRPVASGRGKVVGANVGMVSDSHFHPLKKDGTVSSRTYAINSDRMRSLLRKRGGKLLLEQSDGSYVEVEPADPRSGVVGYVDRSGNFPYCRLTAFNVNQPDKFTRAMSLIRQVDATFAQHLPERYNAQKAVVEQSSPDFYISGTVFTTVTVNLSFQTAVHKDAGDLKQGFGVMAALRAGKFDGCYTVFPQYRIAADMQTGDVLLADVHEWHGNSPIHPKGHFERMSLVFYYREDMQKCGTSAQELERAKRSEGMAHLPGWKGRQSEGASDD